jgi:hypothetical protein
MTAQAQTITRAQALTTWAAARERAHDELVAKAVRLSGQGFAKEASRCRAAARILQVRALQERAQAAARRSADVLSLSRL